MDEYRFLQFDEAAAKVKTLKSSPSNDQMLELYALFKQGTVGDNNTEKPGMLDMKGKAKWSAWNRMSQEDAKAAYVELVNKLVAAIGVA
uniref:ACB domain-containing protein n=1 Tax=Angiostrongylus cantonensis TaxID=6313 RepID=A0A0K0CSR9_ANGCA